jgi:hypothetical protein
LVSLETFTLTPWFLKNPFSAISFLQNYFGFWIANFGLEEQSAANGVGLDPRLANPII